MHARAEAATDAAGRAYWLWLAEEWEKAAMDERLHLSPLRSWAYDAF